MNSLTAKRVETSALPVIDLTGLRSADAADRRAVGRALREACLDKGFFYAANHGVPAELVAAAFDVSRRFFELPLEQKMAVAMTPDGPRRGYEPLGGQTLEEGAPPDLKEGYYLGADGRPDGTGSTGDAAVGYAPNLWPAEPGDFRAVLLDYYAQLTDLAVLLLDGIALSLDLSEDYFREFSAQPTSTLRILHYPPQPARSEPGQKGAGAHTDWGPITLLAQDDNGGLQVQAENGEWIHAEPIPDTFVVNLGDFMARWTNDRYRSTLHRVVNLSGADRYSMPFFFAGRPDYVISSIPTCVRPGEPDRYEPTTPAEHTEMRIRETYGND